MYVCMYVWGLEALLGMPDGLGCLCLFVCLITWLVEGKEGRKGWSRKGIVM